MKRHVQAVRKRSRDLMRLACALGEQLFDSRENLCNIHISTYPDRSGLSVAQQSLEYAIALLETGGDAQRADRIVHRVLDFQVRDPGQLRYGNFIWHTHWKSVKDANAIYFVLPNLIYLWNHHRAKLSSKARRRLVAAWPLCVHAVQRHRVDWSYSNIFLLGILSRFLLAPLLPKTDLDADARAQWRTFLKGTAHCGITEYNSPTYSPVCIYALEQLWAFGPRDLKRQFEAVLEYFYFEFAARYHAPTGFLAGVMSRAYPWDREPGRSFAAIVAHRQWGAPCRPGNPFVVNWLLTNYVAPKPIQRIAMKKRPLEILAEYSPRRIARTDYLAGSFTLASQSGGWYGDQQIPLLITVRGTGSGHALHVEPSIPFAARLAAQQRRTEVFGVYSFDPAEVAYHSRLRESKAPAGFADGLAFRWYLGSRDLVREVKVNGARWDGQPRAWKNNAAILLRLGDAGLALKIAVSVVRSTRVTPSLRLAWHEDRLCFDVQLLDSCAGVTARSRLPAMRFYLRLSEGALLSPSPLSRRFARGDPPAVVSASASCHVIHRSPLATILTDELAEFFLGRAKPPWK